MSIGSACVIAADAAAAAAAAAWVEMPMMRHWNTASAVAAERHEIGPRDGKYTGMCEQFDSFKVACIGPTISAWAFRCRLRKVGSQRRSSTRTGAGCMASDCGIVDRLIVSFA